MTWAHMIDELAAGQPLSESEAETLFAAVFDRGVPELELGGLLVLLEQRQMSQQELVGVLAALSTRVFQMAVPDTQWRPVDAELRRTVRAAEPAAVAGDQPVAPGHSRARPRHAQW